MARDVKTHIKSTRPRGLRLRATKCEIGHVCILNGSKGPRKLGSSFLFAQLFPHSSWCLFCAHSRDIVQRLAMHLLNETGSQHSETAFLAPQKKIFA